MNKMFIFIWIEPDTALMLSYVIRYKFSILLAILIILLSLLPSNSVPGSSLFAIPYMDKVAHFSLYSLLSLVVVVESRCRKNCFFFHMELVLIVFGMSGLIEILQATIVPSRSAEWLDLLANFIGLTAGYVAYRLMYKWNLFRIRS